MNIILEGVNFTTAYPEYKDGWEVVAKPYWVKMVENTIIFIGGEEKIELDISKGFVVVEWGGTIIE